MGHVATLMCLVLPPFAVPLTIPVAVPYNSLEFLSQLVYAVLTATLYPLTPASGEGQWDDPNFKFHLPYRVQVV